MPVSKEKAISSLEGAKRMTTVCRGDSSTNYGMTNPSVIAFISNE